MKMKLEWKGKKLSLEKALFICYHLWDWLSENPNKDKQDWPYWVYNGGKIRTCMYFCSCCEYTLNTSKETVCKKCPLKKYWSKQSKGYMCTFSPSAYYFWKEEVIKSNLKRSKYAAEIRDAAKKELNKLGIEV